MWRTGAQEDASQRDKPMRSSTRKVPWYKPQMMKFRLAPCHKPHRKNTVMRFTYTRHGGTRLPPSGMYK